MFLDPNYTLYSSSFYREKYENNAKRNIQDYLLIIEEKIDKFLDINKLEKIDSFLTKEELELVIFSHLKNIDQNFTILQENSKDNHN